MPSILSRLRMRTHSTASAQSVTVPPSSPLFQPTDNPTLSTSRSEPMLVDRRIVEDLPALLGSIEANETPFDVIRPSQSRRRSGLQTLGLRPRPEKSPRHDPVFPEKENEDVPHMDTLANEEVPPLTGPSAWKGKNRMSSTSSPWSTFGRHRVRPARSPYNNSPSTRSSRKGSVDSAALRNSSAVNINESPQTVSNLASSASVDKSHSSYSAESVISREHTLPRRSKHDITTTSRPFHELLAGDASDTVDRNSREPYLDGRSATAVPHALHVGGDEDESPCSPRFIPPSSLSTSPVLLDAENPSGGVPDNLSRSSLPTDLLERGEESQMANRPNTLERSLSDTRDTPKRAPSTPSRSGTSSRSRSKRASQVSEQSQSAPLASTSSSSNQNGGAGPSSAAFPSISTPTLNVPLRIPRTPRTASEPGLRSVSEKSNFGTPVNNKGKRKADDVDLTPPDQRTAHHATFVIPADGRRSHHVSEVSKAPSSYTGRKRARLSTSSPSGTPAQSRPTSIQRYPTDSWPSRTGFPAALHRVTSKTTSTRSAARPDSASASNRHAQADRRRSMSEISFPISALVAPHAPSVSVRSGGYYMRDPRKPPRVQRTPWSLRLNSQDEQGSPIHAWCFFVGFILFPLWWLASFWRIPQTRRVGGTDTEKAVTLDDPQVEHDARSWRFRCRVMSAISLFTYIPFIILVAIFVPRS